MSKILVVAEQQAGQLKRSTLAAITLARQIGGEQGRLFLARRAFQSQQI